MHINIFPILFASKDHAVVGVMVGDKDHQVEFDEVAFKSTIVHEIFPHKSLKNRVQ